MRTTTEAYELLLHAMGWQERVAGEVTTGQRQGWLPPGEHDGRKIVVELEPGAEIPEAAVGLPEALQTGVVKALFGGEDEHFAISIQPGMNAAGDGVVELNATRLAADGTLPPNRWKRKLEIGWEMNLGLLRETLQTWASQVIRDAPRHERGPVAEVERIHAGATILSVLENAQAILDAGGKGSKTRALRALGLLV